MKTAALLLLGIALPLLAAGPEDRPTPEPTPEVKGEWPQKGDAIFINATFLWKEERWVTKEGTDLPMKQTREVSASPCSGLTLLGIKRSGSYHFRPLLVASADDEHRISLCGDWSSAMFRTADSCRKANHLGGSYVRPGKCLELGPKSSIDDSD